MPHILPTPARSLPLLARLCGFIAFSVGAIALFGWFAHLPRLTDWWGSGISMFVNTGVMGACAGMAVALLTFTGRFNVPIARVLAGIAALIGTATLFQHLTGMNLGIDTLLVREPWGSRAATSPGRPGPPAALSFTMLGLAVVLSTGDLRLRRFVPPLWITVAAIALLSLIGYSYGVDPLFSVARYTGIAMQTATALVILAVGVGALVAERQPIQALLEDSASGALARYALPFIFIVPLLLGWLRLRGENGGLFDREMGTALLVLSLVAVLCVLLCWCVAIVAGREKELRCQEASLVNEISERQRAQERMARLAHEQSSLYQFTDRRQRASSPAEMFEAALDCIIAGLGCNRAAVLLFDEAGAMRFVASRGLSATYRSAVDGHSPWKRGDAAAQPICMEDVETADLPDSLKAVVKAEKICALAFFPIISRQKLIGKFMAYFDRPHRFTAEELAFAVTIAHQLGFGVDRKQSEDALSNSEAMLRAITDHSADLIFVKDLESRTVFINPAGLRMAGLPAEKIIGFTDAEIYPEYPDQAAAFVAADRRVMSTRQPETVEEIARTATGSVYTLLTTKTPRVDAQGEVIGVIGVSHDITEQKRAEEGLRAAAQKAEEASRAKDDFLAALSHELRTPLTPALLTITALEEDAALPADVREQLAMVRRDIQMETRLIDDLLDLTRIRHGKLKVQPVVTDLHEVVELARQRIRADLLSKQLTVDLSLEAEEHHAVADAARLQQVFWNLLQNSVKFTPRGGRITLRSFNPRPGRVAVSISDTGIGIAADMLGRIFQPFDQGIVEGRSEFGGLGLGLSISKAIVDLHRGELRAASEGTGRGAAFTAEFDSVEAPAAARGVSGSAAPTLQPLRMLLVDDHEPTLAAMTRLLRRDGHHVVHAASVKEALVQAAANQCDIIISDLGLPDGSGFELMSEIRRRHGWPGIALSGYGMEADRRSSAECGFAAHLVKPVEVSQLRDAIATTLASATA